MQRRLIQNKAYYKIYYSFIPLKVAAAKKLFPIVCTNDTTCFDEYVLFRVITGRYHFLYKFILTQRFDITAMLLRSLKQLF